mgnify:CR=1 FL=1
MLIRSCSPGQIVAQTEFSTPANAGHAQFGTTVQADEPLLHPLDDLFGADVDRQRRVLAVGLGLRQPRLLRDGLAGGVEDGLAVQSAGVLERHGIASSYRHIVSRSATRKTRCIPCSIVRGTR